MDGIITIPTIQICIGTLAAHIAGGSVWAGDTRDGAWASPTEILIVPTMGTGGGMIPGIPGVMAAITEDIIPIMVGHTGPDTTMDGTVGTTMAQVGDIIPSNITATGT